MYEAQDRDGLARALPAKDIKRAPDYSEALIRQLVKKRDEHRCRCCGETATYQPLHIDHIVPKGLGGALNVLDNLQTLCATCNFYKGKGLACTFDHQAHLHPY